MIRVTADRPGGVWKRIVCSGHALYGDPGFDIVCAGVSALVINAVNSLEQFTEDALKVEEDPQEGGYLSLELPEGASDRAALLLDSLLLGLRSIEETYGEEFLTIRVRE